MEFLRRWVRVRHAAQAVRAGVCLGIWWLILGGPFWVRILVGLGVMAGIAYGQAMGFW